MTKIRKRIIAICKVNDLEIPRHNTEKSSYHEKNNKLGIDSLPYLMNEGDLSLTCGF